MEFFHDPEAFAMKKLRILLTLVLVGVLGPTALQALPELTREEITLEWVKLHNAKLTPEVRGFAKQFKVGPALRLNSIKRKGLAMKSLGTGSAEKYGVPSDMSHRNNTATPLTSLYSARFGSLTFVVADYTSEYDSTLSSSDIYMKVGLHYHHLFHAQGYPGSARLFTLGKNSPLFFEVNTFGGGNRCDRVIYTLNQENVNGIEKDLFENAERIDVKNYVVEVLQLNERHEGYTFYKDVDKDGAIEIANSTRVDCPQELADHLKKVYKQNDLDLGGFTRKVLTFYKWKDNKFVNLGDYFY
jgi:hypothetical protein